MESMYIGKENFTELDELDKMCVECIQKYPDDWAMKLMHDQNVRIRQEMLDELERRVREEDDEFARETLKWYHEYYGH